MVIRRQRQVRKRQLRQRWGGGKVTDIRAILRQKGEIENGVGGGREVKKRETSGKVR